MPIEDESDFSTLVTVAELISVVIVVVPILETVAFCCGSESVSSEEDIQVEGRSFKK
jgi:hypothetical protein